VYTDDVSIYSGTDLLSVLSIRNRYAHRLNRQGGKTVIPFDERIGFFLDFCLPPDRAEETRFALEDLYNERWIKYGDRKARILCLVHSVSTIMSHHWKVIRRAAWLVAAWAGVKKLVATFLG
jgi:hypothetical protein